MESFTAFYRAVPPPLRSRAPLDAVHLLLEMVADDAARRRCGAEPLRTALAALSDGDDRAARPAEPAAHPVRRPDRRGRRRGRRAAGVYPP